MQSYNVRGASVWLTGLSLVIVIVHAEFEYTCPGTGTEIKGKWCVRVSIMIFVIILYRTK